MTALDVILLIVLVSIVGGLAYLKFMSDTSVVRGRTKEINDLISKYKVSLVNCDERIAALKILYEDGVGNGCSDDEKIEIGKLTMDEIYLKIDILKDIRDLHIAQVKVNNSFLRGGA